MKVRTIYFKVDNPSKSAEFWSKLFGVLPHKTSEAWQEIMCGDLRLGFLKNDFGDKFTGSGCVPVFEFSDSELPSYIQNAKVLGANVIVDGLDDPNLKSIVFTSPDGHEFELSKFHD